LLPEVGGECRAQRPRVTGQTAPLSARRMASTLRVGGCVAELAVLIMLDADNPDWLRHEPERFSADPRF
jgi:hypothetical protein